MSNAQPYLLDESGPTANVLDAELVETPVNEGFSPFLETDEDKSTLSIVVVGASGDLARKKIFPALFALFYDDHLPQVPLYFHIPLFIFNHTSHAELYFGTIDCFIVSL